MHLSRLLSQKQELQEQIKHKGLYMQQ
uniref:Uncharacterized protein n=1 Tax=Rhizophora mucronata TaxID=61149 RepID=A0A2P2PMG7_RHIMU